MVVEVMVVEVMVVEVMVVGVMVVALHARIYNTIQYNTTLLIPYGKLLVWGKVQRFIPRLHFLQKLKISSRIPLPLLRPGSFHSGSAT